MLRTSKSLLSSVVGCCSSLKFKEIGRANRLVYLSSCNFARRVGRVSRGSNNQQARNEEGEYNLKVKEKEEEEEGVDEDDVSNSDEEREDEAFISKINNQVDDRDVEIELVKMMREGKSNAEIIATFLGNSAPASSKPSEKKDEENFGGIYNYLASNKDESQDILGLMPKTEEEKRQIARVLKEIRQMEQIQEIMQNSEKQALSESPLRDYKKGKYTPEEKYRMKILKSQETDELLNLSSNEQASEQEKDDVKVEDNKLKKDDYDPDFDFLDEFKEDTKAPYSTLIETNKKSKDMSLDQRVARSKVEGTMREIASSKDEEFKELAQADVDDAAKEMDIYVEKPKAGDRKLGAERGSLELTIYQKADQQIARLIDGGMEPADAKNMVKQFIFDMKKLDEDNTKYQKYLQRKEKEKKIKKLMNETEKLKAISEDIDYNDSEKSFNKKFKKNWFGLPENWDEYQEYHAQLSKDADKLNEYDIFKMRSDTNTTRYIEQHFQRPKASLSRITLGQQITIKEVLTNNALTVINVFWTIEDRKTFEISPKDSKDVTFIQKNLTHYAKYFRGKLCRDLSFKYAPELRFHYSDLDQRAKELQQDFANTAPGILEERIKEQQETGKGPQDPRIMAKQLRHQISAQIDEFVEDFSHSRILKEQKRDSRLERQKKQREENRKKDGGKRKRSKKATIEKKAAKFWNSLKA